jgi:hypothetical protein
MNTYIPAEYEGRDVVIVGFLLHADMYPMAIIAEDGKLLYVKIN